METTKENNSEKLRSYMTLGLGVLGIVVVTVLAALGKDVPTELVAMVAAIVGGDGLSSGLYALARGKKKGAEALATAGVAAAEAAATDPQ